MEQAHSNTFALQLTPQDAQAALVALHALDRAIQHPEETTQQCIDSAMRFYGFKQAPDTTPDKHIDSACDVIFEALHLSTSSILERVIDGDIAVDDLTEDGANELIREIQGKHRQSIAPEGL